MRRVLLGSAVILLLATGCSGSGSKASTSVSPASISKSPSGSASSTATATSSSKAPIKAKPPVGCDSVVKATGAKLQNGTIRDADVLATFNACATMAEFSKATINSPGLVDLSSTDALTFVKKACGSNPSLRTSKLCRAAGATVAASPSSGL